MPRPRSEKVVALKDELRRRLRDGFRLPGERFLSARGVARAHGVSYVTAHRLLRELSEEGLLERRAAAGSFLPGESPTPTAVQLRFHPRARRAGSFGAHLLKALSAALKREDIAFSCVWSESAPLREDHYPVVWELPERVQQLAAAHRFALVLNSPPPAGSAARYVDSVATDDFSGGAWAAQWLRDLAGPKARLAVLTGPAGDPRSEARTAGFLSVASQALVVPGGTWFYEEALPAARKARATGAAGIFCCNDRLAKAVLDSGPADGRPHIIGFDNAPVAARAGLSTIGIPWTELVESAVAVIAARLAGRRSPARRITLPHEPVARATTSSAEPRTCSRRSKSR